jgi:hypothetical protein
MLFDLGVHSANAADDVSMAVEGSTEEILSTTFVSDVRLEE